jgi:D-beta-D-heptose 7-phosphate kinase/D-beta-D-heptose 1-phosphate adenosyltransferase
MLASGATISDAVMIANFAAGIVVAKLGTATITQAELVNHLNKHLK